MNSVEENRYLASRQDLMEEWDWEKNKLLELYPEKLKQGSHQKVWWLCKQCGHSWKAQILSRYNGTGCPECGRKKEQKRTKEKKLMSNSLAAMRPDLLEEWDYELNGELKPENVTASTNQKVWWRCKKCNQAWKAKVAGRNYGRGCPVCAGQVLVVGVNDLGTVNPQLAAEWDYDNNEITPQQVSARNNVKASWICSICGYRWRAYVSSRNKGTGCPQCQKRYHSSLPEQIVFFYVKQFFQDAINGYKIKNGTKTKEVDIYIPSLKLAIEYDGYRWHKDAKRDLEKTKFLNQEGTSLVRIREIGCPLLKDGSYQIEVKYDSSDYAYMTAGIHSLFDLLNQKYGMDINIQINFEEDFNRILSAYEMDKKEKSIAHVNPQIASQWDYDKNGGLMPTQVYAKSSKRAWWRCDVCDYSWKATVYDRYMGSGCPRCSGVVVWSGVNDLQTKRPSLLDEWDYKKNLDLLPISVSYRSNQEAWWLCNKCGYSWSARVADRSAGVGCPACAGKVAVEGRTDLATINPELASEWDYEKNGSLLPQMMMGGSNKKIWWICKTCAHSWEADVYSRNTAGHGCPKCSRKNRKRIVPPELSLANKYPHIAAEWDYEKNGDVLPEGITYGSKKKIYWICKECGNSWYATPNSRTTGRGCPECAVKRQDDLWHRKCVEKNNFKEWCETNEKMWLLEEWDYEANDGRAPETYSFGSNQRVAWICRVCGHRWLATISNRGRGSGCPNCFDMRRKGEKNSQAVVGDNSLEQWCYKHDRQNLLNEWNLAKNKYPAKNYTYGSKAKVWWICHRCSHEWEAEIKSRTSQGNNCPKCSRKRKKEQGE